MGSFEKTNYIDLSNINLTLFFTSGVSLKTWEKLGSINREIAIYKELGKHLKSVNFVTYGGQNDKQYANCIKPINLYPTLWTRINIIDMALLLWRHQKMLKKIDIIKTNQVRGSEIPVWLKKKYGKKLIIRCGYLHSRFTEMQTNNKRTVVRAYQLERNAFTAADIGVVSTERDKNWVIKTHNIPKEKIFVIPNYVDLDIFRPSQSSKDIKYDLVFVGRPHPQKNLYNLLKAAENLKQQKFPIKILFIGGCSNDNALKNMSAKMNLNTTRLPNIPNTKLPEYFKQSKIFILPSNYEGHPKVLLEAMGCGMPCIGTNVAGIKEVLKHKETGYLCETDSDSIAYAIKTVLADYDLRVRMGSNAHQYILSNFSLDRVLQMELDVINKVINQ